VTDTIKASRAPDLDEFDFAVDTALSWDGEFPDVGSGDYIVEIGSIDGDGLVLVSRRYVGASSAEDAAEIALDAFSERHNYETDNKGNLIPVETDMSDKPELPAWVASVKKVVRG
jgi:hypothetical protein